MLTTNTILTPGSVGRVDGGTGVSPFAFTPLAVPYELPEFCHKCQDEQRFLVRYEVSDGRLGVCSHCGREKTFLFSRTTVEAA